MQILRFPIDQVYRDVHLDEPAHRQIASAPQIINSAQAQPLQSRSPSPEGDGRGRQGVRPLTPCGQLPQIRQEGVPGRGRGREDADSEGTTPRRQETYQRERRQKAAILALEGSDAGETGGTAPSPRGPHPTPEAKGEAMIGLTATSFAAVSRRPGTLLAVDSAEGGHRSLEPPGAFGAGRAKKATSRVVGYR